MGLGHERLNVYRAAIDYAVWAAYHFCEELKGHHTIGEETHDYVLSRKDADTDADPEGSMQPAHRQLDTGASWRGPNPPAAVAEAEKFFT